MANSITYGYTWHQKFINGEAMPKSVRITKVKPTKYGYIVHTFHPYVVLTYIKLYVNTDGSAVAKVKRCKNYCKDEHLTYYFGTDGREIKDNLNRTRVELQEYKRQRNEYLQQTLKQLEQ